MNDELAVMFGYVFDKLREADRVLGDDDSAEAGDARKLLDEASIGLDDIVIWLSDIDNK